MNHTTSRRTKDERLLIIGLFPPPVHGSALMTLRMAEHLSERINVEKFNTASSRKNTALRHLSQIFRNLFAIAKITTFRLRGYRKIAIASNSNFGLIYTLIHAFFSRMTGAKLSIHHHTYGYIQNTQCLMKAISHLNATHVFLSYRMQEDFVRKYPHASEFCIVPNAMFVERPAGDMKPRQGAGITIGHLSNLSKEKGLYEVLEFAKQAKLEGLPVEVVVGGPIRNEIDRSAVESSVLENNIKYVGPVYSEKKIHFFENLDIFLLPTNYRLEAQPTVIYEAFAHGVPVLSYRRGTICDQIGNNLASIEAGEDFVAAAIKWTRFLISCKKDEIEKVRQGAIEKLQHDTRLGEENLKRLFLQ